MNNLTEYTLNFMEEILNIPSPAGDTGICMKRIEKEFEALGYVVEKSKKDSLYVTIKGEDDEHHKMIVGHVDTLGAIVKEVKPNGRLKLAQIGGFSWASLEGENVLVHTDTGKQISGSILPTKASIHIYSDEVRVMERTDDTVEVRIDEFTKSKEETKALGIKVGDFVSFEPRHVQCDNGFIKSRHIDDKSAVAMILGICKYIKDEKITPKYTTHFNISNYEEVGHGVSYLPEKTDELLAIDIGLVGPNQESRETSVCIAAKDSRTPYDFKLRKKLSDICEKNGIEYNVDVYNRYGSDASVGVLQGLNVNFACVGPGVDATHHYERTHVHAIENTMALLIKYAIQ
ncbi:MAG: M42 family metallopeptidase [Clostridia bacterium]|nr:M42 family metallopeptidase [Clostridia bacterium]